MNRIEKARGRGLILAVQLSMVIEALKIKKGNKIGQGKKAKVVVERQQAGK